MGYYKNQLIGIADELKAAGEFLTALGDRLACDPNLISPDTVEAVQISVDAPIERFKALVETERIAAQNTH